MCTSTHIYEYCTGYFPGLALMYAIIAMPHICYSQSNLSPLHLDMSLPTVPPDLSEINLSHVRDSEVIRFATCRTCMHVLPCLGIEPGRDRSLDLGTNLVCTESMTSVTLSSAASISRTTTACDSPSACICTVLSTVTTSSLPPHLSSADQGRAVISIMHAVCQDIMCMIMPTCTHASAPKKLFKVSQEGTRVGYLCWMQCEA